MLCSFAAGRIWIWKNGNYFAHQVNQHETITNTETIIVNRIGQRKQENPDNHNPSYFGFVSIVWHCKTQIKHWIPMTKQFKSQLNLWKKREFFLNLLLIWFPFSCCTVIYLACNWCSPKTNNTKRTEKRCHQANVWLYGKATSTFFFNLTKRINQSSNINIFTKHLF